MNEDRCTGIPRSVMWSALSGLMALFVLGCMNPRHYHGYPPDNQSRVTVFQGIWGNVWFWEGDFMPPLNDQSGTITPVERTVYAFELTSLQQVDTLPGRMFFSAVHSRLIDCTRSDSTGFYQMSLPPGEYSIFVRDGSCFYANGDDGKGHIFPWTVVKDSVTKVQIDIDYKAYS